MASTSLGTSGSTTYLANWASRDGVDAFHLSLSLRGMTTSLTSGFPRRETCTSSPDDFIPPGPLSPLRTWTCWRSVSLQMPITGLRFASPFSARALIGSSSAMLCTL